MNIFKKLNFFNSEQLSGLNNKSKKRKKTEKESNEKRRNEKNRNKNTGNMRKWAGPMQRWGVRREPPRRIERRKGFAE
jgi:hypothetical protein